ncbi:hypothetical protein NUW54_g7008 [Trametes sanguinea]|uniref:Uncharacterized protein n=1 Tax=Trametes sanguinea TaxID=158606 RepID=A0ACC1PSQ8_9APHY|nr:hypothetical protein NUW54_g7008 [Trametes sanguinea]
MQSPLSSAVAIATFGTALAAVGLALTLFVHSVLPHSALSPSVVPRILVSIYALMALTELATSAMMAYIGNALSDITPRNQRSLLPVVSYQVIIQLLTGVTFALLSCLLPVFLRSSALQDVLSVFSKSSAIGLLFILNIRRMISQRMARPHRAISPVIPHFAPPDDIELELVSGPYNAW